MTTSETAQDAMMESVHRPMPALAPRPFWFLVGVAFLFPPPPAPEIATAIPTITLSDNPTSVTDND